MNSGSQAGVVRVLEPGITAFSAAEIHVVKVLPAHLPSRTSTANLVKAQHRLTSSQQINEVGNSCTLTLKPYHPSFQAVVPIGDVPAKVLEKYYTLITKHRQVLCAELVTAPQSLLLHSDLWSLCKHNVGVQVELQSIQPFYTEQQKSPFKFFPWKTGTMNFRFLPVSAPHLPHHNA